MSLANWTSKCAVVLKNFVLKKFELFCKYFLKIVLENIFLIVCKEIVNVPPDSACLKICNAQVHDWVATSSPQEMCRAITNKMPMAQGM